MLPISQRCLERERTVKWLTIGRGSICHVTQLLLQSVHGLIGEHDLSMFNRGVDTRHAKETQHD
jgi:hypothetical protein